MIPLLEDWIRRYESHNGLPDKIDRSQNNQLSALSSLAALCGVDYSTLRKIARGDYPTVGFSMADRIISKGFSDPWLWWTHFRDIYEQGIPPNKQDKQYV